MEEIATIKDIKKDLEDTISKSKLVSNKEGVPKLAKAVWQAILRLIAPLM